MKKLYFYSVISLFVLGLLSPLKSRAAIETIASGSFIINMGITPQTINNGLKPYGMIYDLLKNFQVPIKWVINQSKLKDSADFTYNSVQYRAGAFIIPAAYRTTAVNSAITSWTALGIMGVTTASNISVDVFLTLQFVPQWTLDKDKGNLITAFFVNAGIPASAHGGSVLSGWKLPSQLGLCDDVFALPHADPTWATHQNLYYWNQNFKGNIWSGCHAVSVLENITNPGATIQMNFLSSTGLVLFGSHKNGSPPYTYQHPTDHVMQFMGNFDGSTINGSEQIYLPKLAGSWRPGTKLLVYDPTQEDVPVKSPGPATVAIYGRAYNDSLRGLVMYQGGHDLDKGTVAERVAAQRAFFNYSFYSTGNKVSIPIDISNIPGVVRHGDTLNITFYLPAGYNPANYTVKWRNSCGGTFIPSDTLRNTRFKVPSNPLITSCVISVTITDACGRQNFASKQILLVPGILQNGWGDLKGKPDNGNIKLTWSTENVSYLRNFIVERSFNGIDFIQIGIVNAIENATSKVSYNFTDLNAISQNNFYRIIAVDSLNNRINSNTIFLSNKQKGFSAKIAPNPVSTGSAVNLYSDVQRWVTISITDLTGKQIFVTQRAIDKGQTKIELSEFNLKTTGIFILTIRDSEFSHVEKFVKLD